MGSTTNAGLSSSRTITAASSSGKDPGIIKVICRFLFAFSDCKFTRIGQLVNNAPPSSFEVQGPEGAEERHVGYVLAAVLVAVQPPLLIEEFTELPLLPGVGQLQRGKGS